MKIRLIIEHRGWPHRLHVSEQQPGRYYVTLRALDGARLEHPVACGPFRSLDLICDQAVALHLQLEQLHNQLSRACTSVESGMVGP